MEAKLLRADRFVDSVTGISYRYVHSETEYFRPHYHDYFELFLLLEGAATHFVNQQSVALTRGALVFIRPSDVHDYAVREGAGFSMLNITFTAETARALLSYLGDGFPTAALLSSVLPPEVTLDEEELCYLLSHMTTIRTIDEGDHGRVQTALRILIFRILTRYFADYAEKSAAQAPAWLEELCGKMKHNSNFTYGIERMLSLTDKSREHLARSIKKYLGVTLSEFINDLRLSFIANMLKNSNHDIADIIFESGFGNISWSSVCFKKNYGKTMREYRKEG